MPERSTDCRAALFHSLDTLDLGDRLPTRAHVVRYLSDLASTLVPFFTPDLCQYIVMLADEFSSESV